MLDNVCPEWMKGGKPNIKILREYEKYRLSRIAATRPRVIVLLGMDAFKAFGVKGGAVKSCGLIKQVNGIPVVLSIHPAFALRDKKQWPLFEYVFRSIKVLLGREAKYRIVQVLSTGNRVRDQATFQDFLHRLAKKPCAFDLETYPMHPPGKILCASIADGKMSYWIPLQHPESWGRVAEERLKLICQWWPKGPRIVQHLKMEVEWMRSLGCPDPKELYDTMLQSWLLDENSPNNLDHQTVQVLQRKPYWLDLPETDDYSTIPLKILGPYNANDAGTTFELNTLQRKTMTPEMRRLADDLTTPLAKEFLKLEQSGVCIDPKGMTRLSKRLLWKGTIQLEAWEEKFGANPASAKQMRHLLFTKWRLRPIAFTKGKKAKVDEPTIAKLVEKEPRLEGLTVAKKTRNLVRKIDPLIELADEHNLVHTSFNLGNVVTGRPSSSNPNLFNIDRKGPQKKHLVSRFTGGSILQFDYSQHELRCGATIVGCSAMLDTFAKGVDIHQRTCDIFASHGVRTVRDRAKNCNFAVIYECVAETLFREYGIPRKEGGLLIRTWNEAYPEFMEAHEVWWNEMCTFGNVESIFGWRRRKGDRRQTCNFPIQNPAFLILALALIEAMKFIATMRCHLILPIYDSLIFDAPSREVARLEKHIPRIMLGVNYRKFTKGRLKQEIPLAVDVKKGEHL